MKFSVSEPGPECGCGMPTYVKRSGGDESGSPFLLCLFHDDGTDAGAMWPLPEEKPDNWPNLSEDEMNALIDSVKDSDDH